MSYLAAVFDTDGIHGGRELLACVEAKLSVNDDSNVQREITRSFLAVSAVRPYAASIQRFFRRNGDLLVIDGGLHDSRPLQELTRILFGGDPTEIRTINGQYNAIIFRPDRNEIAIVTDRLGTRPLYYARQGTRHVCSSSIAGVRAGLSRAFDLSPVGVMELFAFGHNLGQKTLFSELSVFRPGSLITIGSTGSRETQYYEFGYRDGDVLRKPREWGECISTCLKSVAPRYVSGPGRKGVFLSGGLDSRLVGGAVASTGAPVHCYTFGDPESREVRSAAEIARLLRLQHEVLVYPENYLSEVIEEIVGRNECSTPFFHQASVVFHDLMAQTIDCILVGFGGGLSGSMLRGTPQRFLPRSRIADEMLARTLCASSSDVAQVFQPSFFRRYWPETIEGFYSTVRTIDEAHADNVPDVWNMRNRQPRFTYSAPKVDRRRFEVLAPLLDNDYVDLMTTIPLDARRNQLAYRYAIVDGFPQIGSVPWTKTGKPIPRGQASFWLGEAERVSSKALHRILRKMGLRQEYVQDKFRNVAEDMRRDQRLTSKYLDRYLSSGVFPEQVFDAKGIRRVVDRHMSGIDLSHLLGMILTVGVYFGSDLAGTEEDRIQ